MPAYAPGIAGGVFAIAPAVNAELSVSQSGSVTALPLGNAPYEIRISYAALTRNELHTLQDYVVTNRSAEMTVTGPGGRSYVGHFNAPVVWRNRGARYSAMVRLIGNAT